METGAEAPIQIESKPTLGKKEYECAGDKVEVNFAKFTGEGNFNNDPKKAAFLLTGWPMRYDAQVTWGQPQILANSFGVTTYEIDGRPKGNFKGNTVALEVAGVRQFVAELEQSGVNEITLFGHSIGASKVVDLAVALEQSNPNMNVNLVLINPMGIFEESIRTIAKHYMIDAPNVEKRTRAPDRVPQPMSQVLKDICVSLFKDMKALKLRYPKLLIEQKDALSSVNPNLARVKSPVLMLVASEDPVSDPEKLFPKEWMDQITPPASLGENSMAAKVRVSKAREQYLKENVLPNASSVDVIVATKYANHIAFGVERPKSTSHIISRYFDRLRREKAA